MKKEVTLKIVLCSECGSIQKHGSKCGICSCVVKSIKTEIDPRIEAAVKSKIAGDKLTKKLFEYDFVEYINEHIKWSNKTFGAGIRNAGIIKHIKKELKEIEENPSDLEEWIDVIILAIDGAFRNGFSAQEIWECLKHKQKKNMSREWPKKTDVDEPIEHVEPSGIDIVATIKHLINCLELSLNDLVVAITDQRNSPSIIAAKAIDKDIISMRNFIASIRKWLEGI